MTSDLLAKDLCAAIDHACNVPMSALNSQIGHPQGACGAAGIAATLIAMEHRQIPPTINLENPDPECDLDYVPNVARERQLKYVLSNSFGFGGHNACLILVRAP